MVHNLFLINFHNRITTPTSERSRQRLYKEKNGWVNELSQLPFKRQLPNRFIKTYKVTETLCHSKK